MSQENYNVWYEAGEKVLYVKTLSKITSDDVHGIMARIDELLGEDERSYIIGDISEISGDLIGLIDKEAREVFKRYTCSTNFKKVAIVGVNPVIRMAAKVTLATIGDANAARFFKTRGEAIAWLKEDTLVGSTAGIR